MIWEKTLTFIGTYFLSEAGGPTQHPDVTSPTNNNIAMSEDEFEATKESPQFWDIKF